MKERFSKAYISIINNNTGIVSNNSFVNYCSPSQCYNSIANYKLPMVNI